MTVRQHHIEVIVEVEDTEPGVYSVAPRCHANSDDPAIA